MSTLQAGQGLDTLSDMPRPPGDPEVSRTLQAFVLLRGLRVSRAPAAGPPSRDSPVSLDGLGGRLRGRLLPPRFLLVFSPFFKCSFATAV